MKEITVQVRLYGAIEDVPVTFVGRKLGEVSWEEANESLGSGGLDEFKATLYESEDGTLLLYQVVTGKRPYMGETYTPRGTLRSITPLDLRLQYRPLALQAAEHGLDIPTGVSLDDLRNWELW